MPDFIPHKKHNSDGTLPDIDPEMSYKVSRANGDRRGLVFGNDIFRKLRIDHPASEDIARLGKLVTAICADSQPIGEDKVRIITLRSKGGHPYRLFTSEPLGESERADCSASEIVIANAWPDKKRIVKPAGRNYGIYILQQAVTLTEYDAKVMGELSPYITLEKAPETIAADRGMTSGEVNGLYESLSKAAGMHHDLSSPFTIEQ